jgi:hypothetical protein
VTSEKVLFDDALERWFRNCKTKPIIDEGIFDSSTKFYIKTVLVSRV